MNSDDLWRDLQQIRLENAMHFNEIQKNVSDITTSN